MSCLNSLNASDKEHESFGKNIGKESISSRCLRTDDLRSFYVYCRPLNDKERLKAWKKLREKP